MSCRVFQKLCALFKRSSVTQSNRKQQGLWESTESNTEFGEDFLNSAPQCVQERSVLQGKWLIRYCWSWWNVIESAEAAGAEGSHKRDLWARSERLASKTLPRSQARAWAPKSSKKKTSPYAVPFHSILPQSQCSHLRECPTCDTYSAGGQLHSMVSPAPT